MEIIDPLGDQGDTGRSTMSFSGFLTCGKCPGCASSLPRPPRTKVHIASLCKLEVLGRCSPPQDHLKKKRSRIDFLHVVNTLGNPSQPFMLLADHPVPSTPRNKTFVISTPYIMGTPLPLWTSYLPPKKLEGRRGSRGRQKWNRDRWSVEPCQS